MGASEGISRSVSLFALPCIIPRSAVVSDLERRLQFALVAYVGGSRLAVSCRQVEEALVHRVGIPRDVFSVHSFMPEDFLIMFATGQHRDRVSALPSLPCGNSSIFFQCWTRQAQAQRIVAESRVHLVIEGIPPHVWDRSTVDHLLGTSAVLEEMSPETASREDLSMFRASAWARDVESIPTARLLWVPEPVERVPPRPAPIRRLRELGMLEYRVLLHVVRIEEYATAEGPAWRRNSPGSDVSGLPSLGSLEEGF
jgi:hypothetical protein